MPTHNVRFCGKSFKRDTNPKYPGITLDGSLTRRKHLETVGRKLKSRNDIVGNIAGTNWGAQAPASRISTQALVYSVSEHWAPVWERSSHTNKVDVQLNSTMRMMSGAWKSTLLPWLPFLNPFPNLGLSLERPYGIINLHLLSWKFSKPLSITYIHSSSKWPCSYPGKHRAALTELEQDMPEQKKCFSNGNDRQHCGNPVRNVKHIIREYLPRKFQGTWDNIFTASPEAITWIESSDLEL